MTIAFDEAGNTGEDLLNLDQPAFSLASVHIEADAAPSLLEPLHSSQSKEVHFKSLKNTAGGKAKILRFLESPALSATTTKISIVAKSFFLTSKIADMLVEPVMRRAGIDFYENGENISYSNILHLVVPSATGPELIGEFRRRFVEMFRRRTQYHIDKFYSVADQVHRATLKAHGENAGAYISAILESQNLINDILGRSDRFLLDPGVSAFVQISNHWGVHLKEWFDVIFDESKIIEGHMEILKAISSKEEAETIVGSDRRTAVYPLKISHLKSVKSHDYPQIQIADVLASATAYMVRQRLKGEDDDLSLGVERIINERNWNPFILWPVKKFTPEELGTTGTKHKSPSTHVSEILSRRLKR